MNRDDLQELAKERVLDAEALIQTSRWSFAYYVAGYAVECALKSCLLTRMIDTGWVFQDKAKIAECLTHDFGELIRIAGMSDLLSDRLAVGRTTHDAFGRDWGLVSAWKVEERYVPKMDSEAMALFSAITDQKDGVLPWIMKYW